MNAAQKADISVFEGISDGTAEIERDRFVLALLSAILGDDEYTGKTPLTDCFAALELYEHSARPLNELRQRYAGILRHESTK